MNEILLLLSIILLFIFPFFYAASCLFGGNSTSEKLLIGISLNILTMIMLLYILSLVGCFTPLAFVFLYLLTLVAINGYFFMRGIARGEKKHFTAPGVQDIPVRLHRKLNDRKVLLLCLAVGVGFIVRLYDSFIRKDLSNCDAYIHYRMTLETLGGDNSINFSTYNRGFHLIIISIHWLTGASVYDCIRFTGPILCSLSVLAVYSFVKSVKGPAPALLAALLYGCVTFGNPLLRRQTISLSEAPVFFLIPLALIFAFHIKPDIEKKCIDYRNAAGFVLPAFLIALIHPISAMYFQYLVTIFLSIALSAYVAGRLQGRSTGRKTLDRRTAAAALIMAAVIFLVMPVTVYGYADLSNKITGGSYIFEVEVEKPSGGTTTENSDLLGESGSSRSLFKDIFSFDDGHGFREEVSPPAYYGILFTTLVSLISALYFFRKDFFITFLGASVTVMGFILITGFGEPSMYRFRAGVYFIMFALIFWGVFLETSIRKISRLAGTMQALKGTFVSDRNKLFTISFVLLFAFLITAAPFFTWGYTHLGYEDEVEITLDILGEFPAKNVTVFSGDFGGSREGIIIEGHGGRHVTLEAFNNLTDEEKLWNMTAYNFFIIENRPYPITADAFAETTYRGQIDDIRKALDSRENITREARAWLDRYSTDHGHVGIYFESDDITVYLLRTY